MNNSSMIYTIGMALDRAQESGAVASILVGGQWITGTVVLHDGHGVVLDNTIEHIIAKLEFISAVRVVSGAAEHDQIERGPAQNDAEDAIPMPSGSYAG